MTQETGACAESVKDTNGITVKADKDFGAIQVALCVSGRQIDFFISVEEAASIALALSDGIREMKSSCCRGACNANTPADETNTPANTPVEAIDEDSSEENKV